MNRNTTDDVARTIINTCTALIAGPRSPVGKGPGGRPKSGMFVALPLSEPASEVAIAGASLQVGDPASQKAKRCAEFQSAVQRHSSVQGLLLSANQKKMRGFYEAPRQRHE